MQADRFLSAAVNGEGNYQELIIAYYVSDAGLGAVHIFNPQVRGWCYYLQTNVVLSMVAQPVTGQARIQNPGLSLNLTSVFCLFFFPIHQRNSLNCFFIYQRLIRQKHPRKIFVRFLELN